MARVLLMSIALLPVAIVAEGAVVAPASNASLRLVGRVVDGANVLSPAAEAEITRRLADFEASSGVQIVVATVPSLEGKDIETVALDLGRRWALGGKESDNGVLLLVAPNERRVRIEVGYGLEGDLTDAIASRIIRNRIVPAFRRNDLDTGVRDGVEGILEALGGEPAVSESERPARGAERVRHYAPAIVFWIFFLIILFSNFGGGRRRRGGLARAIFWANVLGGLPHNRSGGFRGGGFGGGGGGGFSGGGGSFGGGGASGSW
jgi:uncharacterized protein